MRNRYLKFSAVSSAWRVRAMGSAVIWVWLFAYSFGQHAEDFTISVSEGLRLHVSPMAEVNLFEDFAGVLFQDSPGFDSTSGTFEPGDQIGFKVRERLLFWNGSEVENAPGGETIEIEKGPFSLNVSSESESWEGFVFGTAGSFGGIHEHLGFTLQAGVGDATGGVYGMVWELTSPQYESSDPFLINLGHLDESFSSIGQINAGVGKLTAYVFPIDGDVNRDGTIDLNDFSILKANFGMNVGRREMGDLNGDMFVTLGDFILLKTNFSRVHDALVAPSAVPVPEPTTFLLTVIFTMFRLARLATLFRGSRHSLTK